MLNSSKQRQQKNATKRRKMKKQANRQIVVGLVAVVTFVFCTVAALPKLMDYIQSQQIYNQMQKDYELALNEQAALEIELKKAENPSYIQQYAREKYFLSNPGEVLLVLPDPPKQPEIENDGTFLDKLFRLFGDNQDKSEEQ
ncbi:MAG: FtsB family cell division protein [Culicoidibacterales bacterium]